MFTIKQTRWNKAPLKLNISRNMMPGQLVVPPGGYIGELRSGAILSILKYPDLSKTAHTLLYLFVCINYINYSLKKCPIYLSDLSLMVKLIVCYVWLFIVFKLIWVV